MIKKYQKGGPKLTFPEVNRMFIPYTQPSDNTNVVFNGPNNQRFSSEQFQNVPLKQQKIETIKKVSASEKLQKENKLKKQKEARTSIDNPNSKFTFPDGSQKTQDQMNWREKAYTAGLSLGVRSKIDENNTKSFIDEYLNPFPTILEGLGTAPYVAKQTNSNMPYVAGIGMPLALGAFAGIGSKTTGQFVNNLVNPLAGLKNSALRTLPKAKSFKDALGTFIGIPTERSLPRLSLEELKTFRQVQEIGRMKATDKPIFEQYIYALDQNIPDKHFEKIFGKSKTEVEQILPSVIERKAIRSSIPNRERFNLERINNPNELSPLPEELNFNTFSNRGRTLINSRNPRLNLLETAKDDWQRYVDNKVPTSEIINNKFANIVSEYPYYKGPVLENVPSLNLSTSGNLKNVSKKVENQSVSGISSGDIFTGSLNTSHNSYLPQIKQVFKYTDGTPQFLGYKPMNNAGFLSRFDYSKDDIVKYLNTEIDEQIKRGVIPKNISRPYSTNKPNASYQDVMLPQYGIKQFKEGGMVNDNNGYLTSNLHNFTPKKIIKSNRITTQGMAFPIKANGVPLYPNTGDYIFPTNRVVELPMFQEGGTEKDLYKIYTDYEAFQKANKAYTDSLRAYQKSIDFNKKVQKTNTINTGDGSPLKVLGNKGRIEARSYADRLVGRSQQEWLNSLDPTLRGIYNSGTNSRMLPENITRYPSPNWYDLRSGWVYNYKKPVEKPVFKGDIRTKISSISTYKPFDPQQSLRNTAPDYNQMLSDLQTQQQTPKVTIPYGFGEPRYNNNDYNILHYKQGEEPTVVPKEYRGISDASPYIMNKYQQGGPILNNRSMLFNQMPNPTFLPLDRSRKYYLDNKRKRVSETKIGIGDERGEWVIPTTINGVQLSEQDAVDHFYQTGEHMGGPYETIDESNKSAESRTRAYNGLSALEDYKNGGIPDRYKKQGFTRVGQEKDSTRPGKKWMVLAKKGDSYKVVHGGDSSMQDYTQHHDNQRKKNFWNRMGHTSDKFSPRYWHQKLGKWEEGGTVNNLDSYKQGGYNIIHNGQPMYKTLDGRIVKRGLWSNTYLSNKK